MLTSLFLLFFDKDLLFSIKICYALGKGRMMKMEKYMITFVSILLSVIFWLMSFLVGV